MSWFKQEPSREVERRDPFDPRPQGYAAGEELLRLLDNLHPTQQVEQRRTARSVQRQRHHINEHEYIDTETFTEIEESHTYKEWRY